MGAKINNRFLSKISKKDALPQLNKRFSRMLLVFLTVLATGWMALWSGSVFAMELRVVDRAMILSGEVIYADLDRVKKAFASHPNITHVVLRNSMGGNSWTGYRIGELFRERGVTTAVSGFCVSSCSRLFLGGKQRVFTDDFPQSLTYIGFHGHYDFGKLNPEAVKKHGLIAWTLKYSDNKIDPKLLARWANIARRAGDVRFYPDDVAVRWKANTFLCEGTESRRPQLCERIATSALAQGVVTINSVYSSPDAATLIYKQRERALPNAERVNSAAKNAIKSQTVQREFDLFLDAALPRAFAIAPDGRSSAWSANSPRANEIALEQCARKAKTQCKLFAVDERAASR
jgi:hypothetical protein